MLFILARLPLHLSHRGTIISSSKLHRHISPKARFDGHAAGWVVYEAGTAHYSTVSDGRALILYLLPAVSIEFTR
jgi:hypothetical protein